MTPLQKIVAGIFLWFLFGYLGFLVWCFEMYLNNLRMKFKDKCILFLIMVFGGFAALLLSFTSVKKFIK